MVLSWLRRKLRERRSAPVASRPYSSTAALRVDAKAEGLKAEAGALLHTLVALKEEEVSLARRSRCADCEQYRDLAASLGAPIA